MTRLEAVAFDCSPPQRDATSDATSVHSVPGVVQEPLLQVALVGGSDLIRQGVRSVLDRHEHRRRVQLLVLDSYAMADLVTLEPEALDLVLVDAQPGIEEAVARIQRLVAAGFDRVVACGWSPATEAQEHRLLEAGAAGSLSWRLGADDLVAALLGSVDAPPRRDLRVLDPTPSRPAPGARSPRLSGREAEILALICQGMSNDEIACHLHVSVNTLKSAIRSAYAKIGVTTRSCAVIWGVRHGCTPSSADARLRAPVRELAPAGADDLQTG